MGKFRTLAAALSFGVAALFMQSETRAGDAASIGQLLGQSTVQWSGRSFPVERLRETYEARANAPIWTNGTALNEAGRALIDEISNSYRDGLDPSEYLAGLRGFNEIASLQDAAALELAMSHAFLTLGRDMFSGLTTPSVTDPNIVIRPKEVNVRQWLEGAATTGPKEMMAALRPNHPQYGQLRQMLAGYRALLLRGGWKPIDDGPTLKPEMRDARVAQMRDNLRARGYDLSTADPELYDEGLKEALVHFQKRHGLDADGIAGPATFRALSVSAEDRVKQIAINLERWRWLPRQLGRRHILVNQAGFEMFTMDGRSIVDRRPVIVGKPFHQSPMFSDEIVYSEFNPTWTVPLSIAGKEMLPKIRNNPAYLSERNYKVYSGWSDKAKPLNPFAIDWSAVSARKFPYRIVQQPGDDNALGRVKFIFPNKFSVYMHDTPSRSLFSRTGRAFSHGCIRVYKPLEYAKKLYELQGGMEPSRVDSIVASGERKRVNLKQKMPVHLAYFTAWVDDNGIPLFFDDVYERDRLVGRYLF